LVQLGYSLRWRGNLVFGLIAALLVVQRIEIFLAVPKKNFVYFEKVYTQSLGRTDES